MEDFENILEKAGISVMDSLGKRFLVPVFSVLLAVYAKVYSAVKENYGKFSTKIVSKGLRKIIALGKTAQKAKAAEAKDKFEEIEDFLESIRNKV